MIKKQEIVQPKKPAGRIIFALSFNRSRLDATFFPSNITHALYSYYYVRRSKGKSAAVTREVLTRIRKKAKKVYVDSGIFTINIKTLKMQVASKLGSRPLEQTLALHKEAEKHLEFFGKFARGYAHWLRDHDDLYDWAFELDFDMVLSTDFADRIYEYLRKMVPHPEKIIRIWHHTRTFADWVAWCESGRYKYLAVEGGGAHDRDPEFYRRYIEVAHKNGVKVHILALTDFEFLRKVPVDTGDSSSWMSGSRYGYIYTPYGRVSFGKGSSTSMPHWDILPKIKQVLVQNWLKSRGLEWRGEIMKTDWRARELANIQYFLEMDTPYEYKNNVKRVSFLYE